MSLPDIAVASSSFNKCVFFVWFVTVKCLLISVIAWVDGLVLFEWVPYPGKSKVLILFRVVPFCVIEEDEFSRFERWVGFCGDDEVILFFN